VLLEAVVAVPMLAAIAGAMAWGLSLVAVSAGLADTARDAARSLARGDDEAAVLRRVAVEWPATEVLVDRSGGLVTVTLTQERGLPRGLLAGRTVTLTARGVASLEWTSDDLAIDAWSDGDVALEVPP
jgi:Flp pilus assembly protein TadG